MRFIESICFKDGQYHNLKWHDQRWIKTHQHFFKLTPPTIATVLPKIGEQGTFKVRVVYDERHLEVSYASYEKKKIQSLALVASNPFDYSFKYQNRATLKELKNRQQTDDIVISIEGLLTDSSYANIALWDGSDWLTPAEPLLAGIRRAQLLSEKKLKPSSISVADLRSFEKISLINAMLDLGELEISTSTIQLAF